MAAGRGRGVGMAVRVRSGPRRMASPGHIGDGSGSGRRSRAVRHVGCDCGPTGLGQLPVGSLDRLARLATGAPGWRFAHRAELADRCHPGRRRSIGGGGRPGWEPLGLPSGRRIGHARMAGPPRCPDRLGSLGHPRRRRYRDGVRGRWKRGPARVGGYYAFSHNGAQIWGRNATDPNGNYGVQAGMSVGNLSGVNAVVAPSLGQNEYAFAAGNGAGLPGWPFFTADSGFTTPALADLYGNGQTEVVEGGDSTAGVANGVTYSNGGHLRVLGPGGNLICDHDTNQTVDSSPAVGTSSPVAGRASPSAPGRFTAGHPTPTPCSAPTPTATSCGGPTSVGTRRAARPSVISRATATSRWSKGSTPDRTVWCGRSTGPTARPCRDGRRPRRDASSAGWPPPTSPAAATTTCWSRRPPGWSSTTAGAPRRWPRWAPASSGSRTRRW